MSNNIILFACLLWNSVVISEKILIISGTRIQMHLRIIHELRKYRSRASNPTWDCSIAPSDLNGNPNVQRTFASKVYPDKTMFQILFKSIQIRIKIYSYYKSWKTMNCTYIEQLVRLWNPIEVVWILLRHLCLLFPFTCLNKQG